ncbi:hypothetical protein DENIS_3353 [Desulfonema ishimotonii]|uniref:Uncharacterized protein n=1 Tax=Desulfonema ishimotonii TaxID=45657 RepID=A0A401FZH6_9BACT|nr:hypothetical protein DENIS_3353 [Desulfonema ishimotonii]
MKSADTKLRSPRITNLKPGPSTGLTGQSHLGRPVILCKNAEHPETNFRAESPKQAQTLF